MKPQINVIEQREDRHRHDIARALTVYNEEVAGPFGYSPIAITIGDADARNMLGGPRSDRSRKH